MSNLPEDAILDLLSRSSCVFIAESEDTLFNHSLRTAAHALHESAPDHLVAAALLHDIGHALGGVQLELDAVCRDVDHAELGGQWLGYYLPPEVTEPIAHHVAAKRYLCYADSQYMGRLGKASLSSLQMQGGPMSSTEAKAFSQSIWFEPAVRLRRWDDAPPRPTVPPLHSFRDLLRRLLANERLRRSR